ncbi:MAG: hypothetical protein M3R63_11120, partial [Actinomycetota bacterium]|nr:hypothetical protein [Actinomycetota bacterium]
PGRALRAARGRRARPRRRPTAPTLCCCCAPEGTPGHWVAYFAVADVDTSVAAAERGGGSCVRPAQDTPFGRMASLVDPFGAAFAVHGPTRDGG